jgi:hypothetical protein
LKQNKISFVALANKRIRLNGQFSCQYGPLNFHVIIMSSASNFERRQIMRRRWHQTHDISPIFLIGAELEEKSRENEAQIQSREFESEATRWAEI